MQLKRHLILLALAQLVVVCTQLVAAKYPRLVTKDRSIDGLSRGCHFLGQRIAKKLDLAKANPFNYLSSVKAHFIYDEIMCFDRWNILRNRTSCDTLAMDVLEEFVYDTLPSEDPLAQEISRAVYTDVKRIVGLCEAKIVEKLNNKKSLNKNKPDKINIFVQLLSPMMSAGKEVQHYNAPTSTHATVKI